MMMTMIVTKKKNHEVMLIFCKNTDIIAHDFSIENHDVLMRIFLQYGYNARYYMQ